MTRSALGMLAAVVLVACEGRELSVFDVPAMAGGSAQAGAAAGGTTADGMGGSSAGAAGAPSAGSTPIVIGGSDGGGAGAPPNNYGGAGGAGMTTPTPCHSMADCQPGWVCNKAACGATALGQCELWPPFCDPAPRPVCGCNGITYWNDCVRLQAPDAPAASGPGPCQANACTCEVGSDCNVPYASCSHLLPPNEACAHGMGACWVLPPDCDPAADPKRWRECKPPPDGSAPQCVDTCTAILTEHSYAELHRDETCN